MGVCKVNRSSKRRRIQDAVEDESAGAVICDALATLTALSLQFDLDELEVEIATDPQLAAEIIHSLTVSIAPTLSVDVIEHAIRDVVDAGAPLLSFAPVPMVRDYAAALAVHPAQPWGVLEEFRAELGSSLRALHRHLCSLPPPDARVLH